jgi:hypothetical protein
MAKYRKTKLTDALCWTGDNFEQVVAWASELGADVSKLAVGEDRAILVETLEGTMSGKVGCYLMCGAAKELYPCARGIFRETYELAG